MTLKDIAERAGVSVSTVSRILNDKDTKAASSEVRERVWQIINETGYVPNANARDLRSSSWKNHGTREKEKSYFACVYARSSDSNDHFFSELANAVKYEAYKKGYILKCSFYASDLNKKSFMATVKDQNISGFVVLGRFANDYANYIMGEQKNVVYVSLNPVDTKHDTIYCNGRKAGMMATEHLLSMGHTEIAYVGEMAKENRFAGYREALMAHGLEIDTARVVEAKQTLEGGYQGARQLCERAGGFTAVFCANDATAMGCIKYLRETGIKVPEQVSVISVDDIEMSRYFNPMLTTIHIPIDELGRQAAKMLIDRIEKGHSLPLKMELPFSLSNRDSCAPCGRKTRK